LDEGIVYSDEDDDLMDVSTDKKSEQQQDKEIEKGENKKKSALFSFSKKTQQRAR